MHAIFICAWTSEMRENSNVDKLQAINANNNQVKRSSALTFPPPSTNTATSTTT